VKRRGEGKMEQWERMYGSVMTCGGQRWWFGGDSVVGGGVCESWRVDGVKGRDYVGQVKVMGEGRGIVT
jgi:hypothetical protein